jgi:hypothetical protein
VLNILTAFDDASSQGGRSARPFVYALGVSGTYSILSLGRRALTGEEETAVKHTSGSRARISVMKNGLDELASSPAPEASTPPWTYAAILLPS